MLLALLPALLAAWLHPRKPSWGRKGEVALVAVAKWSDVLWIDARPPAAFTERHVPDAVNLTPASWNSQLESVLQVWKPGMRVVVYCDGHGCEASYEVAARLKAELGFKNVHVLTGGWDAWLRQHPEVRR
jgi:rhodanese-related sulfurtransferase